MESLLKKIIFSFTFNLTLFLVLIIGIQNSSNKRKVNLLINETVKLPTGFIVGVSFISGSVIGGILNADFNNLKK
tara:strand:- start:329 stop:553 length:225 start_codon:yes stop_codon:yes gene_type:complete